MGIYKAHLELLKMATIDDFVVKWNGKEYIVSGMLDCQTLNDLKLYIEGVTGVKCKRQKLLGLKVKGQPLTECITLKNLGIRAKSKIILMGTLDENLLEATEPPEDLPLIVDDFELKEEEILCQNRTVFLDKVDRRIKEYKIDILNEPRKNMKLLVLDIDYTLFDHKSVGETGRDLMRPYLHEFLSAAYVDYDIVIWSATSMKWIKAKMEELHVLNNDNYKLCFMLDSLAMITVHTEKYGVVDVKPLGVIWGKFSQWDKTNSIMFDDIRRNFLMNPQNGLKIRPFCDAHKNRAKDKELKYLSKYLKHIASVDDFSVLDHNKWEVIISSKKYLTK